MIINDITGNTVRRKEYIDEKNKRLQKTVKIVEIGKNVVGKVETFVSLKERKRISIQRRCETNAERRKTRREKAGEFEHFQFFRKRKKNSGVIAGETDEERESGRK